MTEVLVIDLVKQLTDYIKDAPYLSFAVESTDGRDQNAALCICQIL